MMPVFRFLRWAIALRTRLVAAVRAARAAASKSRAPDDRVILVPASAGPVVESRDTKYPVPLSHVPVRSSKADAKRAAHQYAERRAGRALTWKKARQLLNEWEREERAADRAAAERRFVLADVEATT